MKEEKLSLLQRCIKWRENNIKEKQFILILSFLVGIFTAFAALLLKFFIHQIQNFLTDNFNATEANYLYLVYPVVGIFLAGWFVRNIVKDDISHGVTKILYAISRRQGRIKRHNIWSSTIASAITIGFGGSVGAEAPIVLTGSAIGSNLGSVFKMEHRTLMLLVGCGAAGAIAGIFKAPIAGLVFTLEVLMIDLTMSSLLPLLISAVTAATVSYITTGTEAMFKFHLDQAFELERILTPEEDAARGLVQLLEFGADMETFRVAPDYYVVKFTVPDKFIGYYANELNLDKEFGLKMLALKRAKTLKNCLGVSYVEHNVLNELPENDQIQAGDQLVCYGRYKDFQKFWKAL